MKSPFLEILKAQLDKALGNLSDFEIKANFKFGATLGCRLEQMKCWLLYVLPKLNCMIFINNPVDYSKYPPE